MFRTLIYPSSGACDYSVELPHWSFCSWFDVCWSFGVVGLEWYPCCKLKPATQMFRDVPPLKIGWLCFPETLLTNYQPASRNISEEKRLQTLNYDGNSCRICGGWSGIGMGVLPSTSVTTVSIIHVYCMSGRGWTIGQSEAAFLQVHCPKPSQE